MGFKLNIIIKGLIVSVLLLAGLVSAEAAKRHYDYNYYKYRHSGLSFGIVIGPAAPRHPVRLQHRRPVVQSCSIRQVSAIARDHGIRYQTIYRTKRAMTVVGFKRGHRVQIRISRAPDCRVMR